MLRRFFSISLLTIGLLSANEQCCIEQEGCCLGQRHTRLGVRYTGPKGIGYEKGYATFEAFLAPRFSENGWIPFIDLRGHTLGMHNWAANAGLGLRYLSSQCVIGVNGYYDYRRTRREHYNQVAAGIEVLGKVWDFRINGYLPVGNKESSIFNTRFDSFQGNSLIVRGKREYAFKSANAETMLHVDSIKRAPIYFALGPYYLNGKGATAWGGQFRTGVELFNRHLRLEGNCSYDHFFGWIGQGQIGLNISLGKKDPLPSKECVSCSRMKMLETKALQPVYRREIIPTGKRSDTEAAKNPGTGNNWFFWFINNTSSSDGTFDSPYPNLATAQANSLPDQVIYVFGGDGTTTGMNEGITLKDYQLLLGASVPHTIPTTDGMILVPPLGGVLPKIANPSGLNVVTLAKNNTVSGFYLEAPIDFELDASSSRNAIWGDASAGVSITRNTFEVPSGAVSGVSLLNPNGSVAINQNLFGDLSSSSFGVSIEVASGTLNKIEADGNTFASIDESHGVFIDVDGGSLNTASFSGNSFGDLSLNARGIDVQLMTGVTDNVSFSNTSFNNLSESLGLRVLSRDVSIESVSASNSSFENLILGSPGIVVGINDSGFLKKFSATNNSFTSLDGISSGILLGASGTSPTPKIYETTISNLVVSSGTDLSFGLWINPTDGGVFDTVNVTNSSFNNFDEGSAGVFTRFSFGSVENLNVSKSTFLNFSNDSMGTVVVTSSGTQGILRSVNISQNTYSNFETHCFGAEINFEGVPGQLKTANISENVFTNFNDTSFGTRIFTDGEAFDDIVIASNEFTNFQNLSFGFSGPFDGITAQSLDISGNTFSSFDYSVGAIVQADSGGGIQSLNFSNNSFSNHSGVSGVSEGIYIVAQSDGVFGPTNISSNTFSGFSGASSGIGLITKDASSTGTFNVLNNSFENFSEFNTSGILVASSSSGGTLGTLNISNSSFSSFDDSANGIVLQTISLDFDSVNLSTNVFTNFSNNSNGLYFYPYLGTFGPISISGNSFSGFSASSKGTDILAVEISSDSLNFTNNSLSNFDNSFGFDIFHAYIASSISSSISGNSFSNFNDNSVGVYFRPDETTFDSVSISGNSFAGFSASSNGIDIKTSSSTFSSLSIPNNSFNNFNGFSIGIEVSPLNNPSNLLNISGGSFSNFSETSHGINFPLDDGTFDSVDISGIAFSNFSSFSMGVNLGDLFSLATKNEFTKPNFSIGDSYQALRNLKDEHATSKNTDLVSGTLNSLSISNCSFSDISDGSGIFAFLEDFEPVTVSNLSISSNQFKRANFGVLIQGFDSVPTIATIINNTFEGEGENPSGISYLIDSSTPSFINISGNHFIYSGNSLESGFATNILQFSGTHCLEFKNNVAFPSSNPAPYSFAANGGTLNRTFGSDSSTNTGDIELEGNVLSPGTCTPLPPL